MLQVLCSEHFLLTALCCGPRNSHGTNFAFLIRGADFTLLCTIMRPEQSQTRSEFFGLWFEILEPLIPAEKVPLEVEMLFGEFIRRECAWQLREGGEGGALTARVLQSKTESLLFREEFTNYSKKNLHFSCWYKNSRTFFLGFGDRIWLTVIIYNGIVYYIMII